MEMRRLLAASAVLLCAAEARDVGVRESLFSAYHAITNIVKQFNNVGEDKLLQGSGLAKCNISLQNDLPARRQPLLLSSDGRRFAMPDSRGFLHLRHGETLRLVCPGRDNFLVKSGEAEAAVSCAGGSEVLVAPGKVLRLKELHCNGSAWHSAKRDEGAHCETPGNYTVIDLGFELPDGSFIPVLQTCFDEANQDAVYAKATVTPSIGGAQRGGSRPSFVQGSFYPDTDVGKMYGKERQKAVFSGLLGSERFFRGGDYFLARGHLAARADFVYSTQQRATFWYVNAAPQWQTFNGGNWNTLESNIRDFAVRKGLELVVYTGTHGVATLPDAEGLEQPLYLSSSDNRIRVPELFWKVVLEPRSGRGVAFVGLNNPHRSEFEKLCPDVCGRLDWLSWRPGNQKLGFGYCCEVHALRTKVPSIPHLEVSALLL